MAVSCGPSHSSQYVNRWRRSHAVHTRTHTDCSHCCLPCGLFIHVFLWTRLCTMHAVFLLLSSNLNLILSLRRRRLFAGRRFHTLRKSTFSYESRSFNQINSVPIFLFIYLYGSFVEPNRYGNRYVNTEWANGCRAAVPIRFMKEARSDDSLTGSIPMNYNIYEEWQLKLF